MTPKISGSSNTLSCRMTHVAAGATSGDAHCEAAAPFSLKNSSVCGTACENFCDNVGQWCQIDKMNALMDASSASASVTPDFSFIADVNAGYVDYKTCLATCQTFDADFHSYSTFGAWFNRSVGYALLREASSPDRECRAAQVRGARESERFWSSGEKLGVESVFYAYSQMYDCMHSAPVGGGMCDEVLRIGPATTSPAPRIVPAPGSLQFFGVFIGTLAVMQSWAARSAFFSA